MMEEKKEDTQSEKAWWQPAMALFLRMSVWIAVPVVIAVLSGKWFDNKYDTEPWGLLSLVGLSFIFSMLKIIKMVLREYKKIENESVTKEKNKDI